MNEAQRRRDDALRRLRRTNRAGMLASVAGTALLIGLAHQATPVGATRRVSDQQVTSTARSSVYAARATVHTRPVRKRKIRATHAPTTTTTGTQQTTQAATTSNHAATVAPGATAQPAPAATQSSSSGTATSSVKTSVSSEPVTSGVS